MIFTRENCKPIEAPTEAQVARSISLTKSSFSALTSADGAYVQAAGGPGLFFIEWRDAAGIIIAELKQLPSFRSQTEQPSPSAQAT